MNQPTLDIFKIGHGIRRGAFTLLELLVVMAIVLIILAVSFPAYQRIMTGNNRKEAINSISVQVAAARSLALASQRETGLLFYEDPANRRQTAMVLVQALQTTANGTEYGGIADRSPVLLPAHVKVATLSAGTAGPSFQHEGNSGGGSLRIILFDEQGGAVIRDSLRGFKLGQPGDPRAAQAAWNLGDPSATSTTGGSTLALVVYDAAAWTEETAGMSADERSQWLMGNTDMITVHPYTGLVQR